MRNPSFIVVQSTAVILAANFPSNKTLPCENSNSPETRKLDLRNTAASKAGIGGFFYGKLPTKTASKRCDRHRGLERDVRMDGFFLCFLNFYTIIGPHKRQREARIHGYFATLKCFVILISEVSFCW